MRAVVSFSDDGEQTLCMVRDGELLIDVTSVEGDTLEFVKLDAETTRELMTLLRGEITLAGEEGVRMRPVVKEAE